jgi:hypothetical protein
VKNSPPECKRPADELMKQHGEESERQDEPESSQRPDTDQWIREHWGPEVTMRELLVAAADVVAERTNIRETTRSQKRKKECLLG